ncbi:MAG: hypothetical protein JO101_03175, partial [Candidatus Eremiobacteraeota bacterium]|nr:hypothetical protein [Candidatus Eremiobacteraeota bacterium]
MAPRRKRASKKAKKTATRGRKKSPTRKKSTARKKSTGRKKSARGRRYSPGAGEFVREEMEEMKEGKLRSGRSGKKVTNPKQAIA